MSLDYSCIDAIKEVSKTATKLKPVYVTTLIGQLNFSESVIKESAKYLIDRNILDARIIPVDGTFEAAIYGLN